MTQRQPTSIDKAAAFWDARLRSPLCTPHDLVAFDAWREAHPAHAQAYRRLQVAMDALRQAYPGDDRLRLLRKEAMRVSGHKLRIRVGVAAGIAALAFCGTALWSYSPNGLPPATVPVEQPPAPTIFQTAGGGRSDVLLSDGSRITLDTMSKVEAAYSAHVRTIRLIQGQAVFEVAKDPSRPFEVIVGGKRIVALGTAFEVRLDPRRVQLTMIEGKVKVSSTKASPVRKSPEQQIVAGQRWFAAMDTDAAWTETVDPASAALWRNGKVEFDRTPLVDAVEEMNRYSPTQIVLADPSIADLPISGMFFTGKQESFATSLAAYFPLTANTDGDRIVLRRAEPKVQIQPG